MAVLDDLQTIETNCIAQINAAQTLKELDDVRVKVLGRKGELTNILKTMSTLPKEEKPVVGKRANEVRKLLEEAIENKQGELQDKELEKKIANDKVDITLPGRYKTVGSQHLINQIEQEMCDIFTSIGYRVHRGPQVETEYYNFTALNTPEDHPARGMADTFYVKDLSGETSRVKGESKVLLRTQTSGVQVHVMESQKPPIYMVAPGRVYRRDAADPSHLPMFNQLEGLVVDKGITFGDLKGTLEYFCSQIFGKDRKVRFRPHFFPFTEPSAEVDVSCGVCHGEGCRFCSHTGWIEVLGCGMVDPNVFGYVGIDPNEYSGFAFGIGIERVAALRYDLPDLRMLVEGDMRFLNQF